MRILVIEDEKKVASFIKRGLEEAGYSVDIAADGEEGMYLAEIDDYDLIILDLILPRKNGLEVCKELREEKITIPILILSARDSVEDKVTGLLRLAHKYQRLEMEARVGELIEAAEATVNIIEDARTRCDAITELASQLARMNQPKEAEARFEKAVALAETIENTVSRAHALAEIGYAMGQAGMADPSDLTYLTSVTSSGGEPMIWFTLRATDEVLKLRVGDTLEVGPLVFTIDQVRGPDVILQADNERWLLTLGDKLTDAHALPPEF